MKNKCACVWMQTAIPTESTVGHKKEEENTEKYALG